MIFTVFHRRLIDCDRSLSHQVHGSLRRQQRQFFDSKSHDNSCDGLFDLPLQFVYGLVVHRHAPEIANIPPNPYVSHQLQSETHILRMKPDFD